MCDSGCAVTFTEDNVTVKHDRATLLDRKRGQDSGLWRIPFGELPPGLALPQHMAHTVYEKKSIQDIIAYLYVCCFSPLKDTWIKAIENGHFATWPCLMVDSVSKYLPKYDAMVK
jgi:hypothetical protein